MRTTPKKERNSVVRRESSTCLHPLKPLRNLEKVGMTVDRIKCDTTTFYHPIFIPRTLDRLTPLACL